MVTTVTRFASTSAVGQRGGLAHVIPERQQDRDQGYGEQGQEQRTALRRSDQSVARIKRQRKRRVPPCRGDPARARRRVQLRAPYLRSWALILALAS
jgi:hypothetical protein